MNKKRIIWLAIIVAVTGVAYKIADDILQKLGIEKQAAETAIINNLLGVVPVKPNCSGDCDESRLQFPKASLLTTIINGDKKTAAKELCEYIKNYCSSKEFDGYYQQLRASAKPINEQPRKVDAQLAESLKKTIESMEAELKKTKDPQAKKMYEEIIAEFRKQYKEASDPTPLTTAWKEKYPEASDSLVRRQLNFYLAEQATVDFTAQTVLKGKTKYFVKPEYESKGKTWKSIYRAGKDVNDVVVAFVKEWLKK
ncbi:MAG: hypothetical protein HOP10_14415 [Chitinophagaceae bacterium]|nr:hypothetical protein [Chitinophagaceae bacterium]